MSTTDTSELPRGMGTLDGEFRAAVLARLERIETLLRVLGDEMARRDRELVALLVQIAGKPFAG